MKENLDLPHLRDIQNEEKHAYYVMEERNGAFILKKIRQ